MSTKKVVPKKKRGRPATGRDPVSSIRLSRALRSAVETWAEQQTDKPSRSEAIRRLVEFALAAKSKKEAKGNK
jgi:metal-responsive CopG/Arc/MetJ family transcriptional regulator